MENIMAQGKLKIATCQFAVCHSIERNLKYVLDLMNKAKRSKADIVHLPECALSGYAGVDFDSTDYIDFDALREATQQVMTLAGKNKQWVVLGSTHQLTGKRKPHNCLYLIGPNGKIADRYDKMFCMPGEMDLFTPGNQIVEFNINGIKCSLLICYDVRFPEIYRELKKRKVECIFQSFYNARQTERTVHTDIMRQSMQCRAASNYFWVSMTNSCAYYSAYPSCLIQPDGKIGNQLSFHAPGLMVNTIDTKKKFYDATADYRALAMKGKLTNGKPFKDARSSKRTAL